MKTFLVQQFAEHWSAQHRADGYYGGRLDTLIMRITDVLLAFPGILLALAIVSVLGPSMNNVIIAVALFSVPVFARIARGSALTVRKLEYVDAVLAVGPEAVSFQVEGKD